MNVELVREVLPAAAPEPRLLRPDIGYVRVTEFAEGTAAAMREGGGPTAAGGREGAGPRSARRRAGTARRRHRGGTAVRAGRARSPSSSRAARPGRPSSAAPGDGALALPLAVLTDFGTAGAAELLVAALAGNKRARDDSANARRAGRPSSACSRCPTAAPSGCRTPGTSRRPAPRYTSAASNRTCRCPSPMSNSAPLLLPGTPTTRQSDRAAHRPPRRREIVSTPRQELRESA